MILMRILPGVLKELSKHVPTVLFQTVEWSELASELPKISRRIIQKEGYEELFHTQKELLHPYCIDLTDTQIVQTKKPSDRAAGEKILTLYFTQLFSPHGLFIDIRSTNFSEEGTHLKWHPTGLWTQFDDKFRQGLLDVYEGFYLQNDELYLSGLSEIGLLKESFTAEERKELGDIFRDQFGKAIEEDQKFELEHFKDSIIRMSNFMLSKKVKISKDFLYLGIYLVTMYSTLEEINAALPVKQIYLDVRGRFNAKEIR
jgi:predicted unusual protein kinase regulating ubiquinone biosynthesis (AarF/ABC1/UbiB family)